jgi:hypothetical protein
LWRNWWNEDWQGKPKYSEKTCPSATLSTTNPTCLDPGLNPGPRGGTPATNRLSYGAATPMCYSIECLNKTVSLTSTLSSNSTYVHIPKYKLNRTWGLLQDRFTLGISASMKVVFTNWLLNTHWIHSIVHVVQFADQTVIDYRQSVFLPHSVCLAVQCLP